MLLKSSFEALDIREAFAHVVPIPDERRGGFLAVRSPHAADLSRRLRERRIWTDARGDILRLGPAPYLDDGQLRDGVAAVGDALRQAASLSSSRD
jgi:kynureninase